MMIQIFKAIGILTSHPNSQSAIIEKIINNIDDNKNEINDIINSTKILRSDQILMTSHILNILNIKKYIRK